MNAFRIDENRCTGIMFSVDYPCYMSSVKPSFLAHVWIPVIVLISSYCQAGPPASPISFGAYASIRDFGVYPSNSPETNKVNLQKATDWAAAQGAALFVTPSDESYPIQIIHKLIV